MFFPFFPTPSDPESRVSDAERPGATRENLFGFNALESDNNNLWTEPAMGGANSWSDPDAEFENGRGDDDSFVFEFADSGLEGPSGVDPDAANADTLETARASGGLGSAIPSGYGDIRLSVPSSITGTDENDLLWGTSADDDISALEGRDWIMPGIGHDTVDGGDGFDMVSYVDIAGRVPRIEVDLAAGTTTIRLSGRFDNLYRDELVSIEGVTGSMSIDTFRDDDGDNYLRGLGGSDTFWVSGGADFVDGGRGQDSVRFGNFSFDDLDTSASLLAGRGWTGEAEGDRYVNIERLWGGYGDDHLTGDHEPNLLVGSFGDDTLMGLGGPDTLTGGPGEDVVLYNLDQELHTVTRLDPHIHVVSYIGPSVGDGTDVLFDIEVIRFADGDLIL